MNATRPWSYPDVNAATQEDGGIRLRSQTSYLPRVKCDEMRMGEMIECVAQGKVEGS